MTMFGWENFGESIDNCQICQCFPPPILYAIRYNCENADRNCGSHEIYVPLNFVRVLYIDYNQASLVRG